MGTWDTGNFNNDAALDLVANVVLKLREEMTPPGEVEDIMLIMGAVETYLVLVKHCGANPPERAELESLRDEVLRVYDAEIDDLEPTPEFKKGRRRVIAGTFRKFLKLVDEEC